MEFFGADELQSAAAVGLALADQAAQRLQLRLTEGDDELSGFLIGHVQLAAKHFKPLAALHAELCHEAAGTVIEACMDHCGVAAGGSGGHIGLLFQHTDAQGVAAQFTGNGAAHRTGAYDQYIKLVFHVMFLVSDRDQRSCCSQVKEALSLHGVVHLLACGTEAVAGVVNQPEAVRPASRKKSNRARSAQTVYSLTRAALIRSPERSMSSVALAKEKRILLTRSSPKLLPGMPTTPAWSMR